MNVDQPTTTATMGRSPDLGGLLGRHGFRVLEVRENGHHRLGVSDNGAGLNDGSHGAQATHQDETTGLFVV